jgi:hypothetical protein
MTVIPSEVEESVAKLKGQIAGSFDFAQDDSLAYLTA